MLKGVLGRWRPIEGLRAAADAADVADDGVTILAQQGALEFFFEPVLMTAIKIAVDDAGTVQRSQLIAPFCSLAFLHLDQDKA